MALAGLWLLAMLPTEVMSELTELTTVMSELTELTTAAPNAIGGEEGAGGGDDESMLSPNFTVAVMLLASVTYMMSTFMLVNHTDDDIRKAAWQVMSGTISIFSAVLLFQGINEIVAFYFLDGAEPRMKLLVNCVHALVWYLLLQALLAYISGAVSFEEICKGKNGSEDAETDEEQAEAGSSQGEEESEVEDDSVMTVRHNMKCWAVLMGHVTGFACINAFGTLQQFVVHQTEEELAPLTPRNIGMTALGGPIAALVVLQFFYFLADKFRAVIALGDDGQEDEFEKIWDEETEETEDDVLGLTLSFTVVQIFRFVITGYLPNEEGELEGVEITYKLWQSAVLAAAGIGWFVIHIIRATYCEKCLNLRRNEQFKVVAGMVCSWCFFFAAQWVSHALVTSEGLNDELFATTSAVVLALMLNVFCYLMIFVLDSIADADWSGKEMDKSIRNLIDTVGILIGFAWEKAFDAAVVTTATSFHQLPNCVVKFILSIIVCSTVIPAWRWYIIPKLFDMGFFNEEEEGEEDEEGEQKEEEGGEETPKPSKKKATAGTGDLGKALLENQDEAASVRAEIARMQQQALERNARMQELKSQLGAHIQDTQKLPAQISQILDEVNRAKATLEQKR